MYFPVAGIEVAPWVPPLTALVVSFFTSMGGVSGAFLLLPFQVSVLGYTTPSVSATNQFFNVVAIPSGVYRYIREGRMVWPLTWVIVAGTLPGVLMGALVRVTWLPDPRHFKLFAGLVLLYISLRLVRDLIRPKAPDQTLGQASGKVPGQSGQSGQPGQQLATVRVLQFSATRIRYEFHGQTFDVSSVGIFSLSFIVGIIGGVYGIGGGAIMAPFLVTFFRLPVYTVAGAALMGTFVTSVAGVAFYQAISPLYPSTSVAPDWTLGLLFGLGGMFGMYLGARMQKHVPARAIKWMLALVIVYTGGSYVLGFLF